jgi:hypothetical protein
MFANFPGIPATALAALTGFDLPPRTFPEQTVPAIVTELLWDTRHLMSDQAWHVADVARAMLKEELHRTGL